MLIQDTNNWQVSHSWPIRNTLVNQFRMGRVDAHADQHGIHVLGRCQLQCDGCVRGLPDNQRECPGIGINRLSGTGGAGNAYTASYQPMWDVSDTTNYVHGNHTFNIGFNYRQWWLHRDLATGLSGRYAFNGDFTGNPVADMLLGYYSGVGVFQPAPFACPQSGNPRELNFKHFAPYFQADWKVISNLTLNLGLRGLPHEPYETNNRMAWRDLNYPLGGMRIADESLALGCIVDGSFYRTAAAAQPGIQTASRVICAASRIRVAAD